MCSWISCFLFIWWSLCTWMTLILVQTRGVTFSFSGLSSCEHMSKRVKLEEESSIKLSRSMDHLGISKTGSGPKCGLIRTTTVCQSTYFVAIACLFFLIIFFNQLPDPQYHLCCLSPIPRQCYLWRSSVAFCFLLHWFKRIKDPNKWFNYCTESLFCSYPDSIIRQYYFMNCQMLYFPFFLSEETIL